MVEIQPELEMANAALAAEWADCPRVHCRTEPPNLPARPTHVRKPIVCFHWQGDGPPPAKGVSMRVRFPDGRPLIRWPAPQMPSVLAAAPKWDGQFPGVRACTTPDAVAAAATLAKRAGVLALPNRETISPKTLSAPIVKEDVAIPRGGSSLRKRFVIGRR